MKRAMFAIVGATMAVLACDESPVAPSDVLGQTWQLVSVQQNGSNPVVVQDRSRYTLHLEDGRVAVKSDCNSCSGSYSLNGSSLDFGPLACTRAFCGEASLDSTYAGALEGTKGVSVRDSEMTMTGQGVTLRFAQ